MSSAISLKRDSQTLREGVKGRGCEMGDGVRIVIRRAGSVNGNQWATKEVRRRRAGDGSIGLYPT